MAWQRYKTKYVGIYYRLADTRRCLDGKPDKCFEITYRREGKAVWEKIGWRSEGYSIEDAALIRGDRVRAIRHPELFGIDPQITLTFNELWEKIKEDWLGMLEEKRARQITWIYNLYIKPLGSCLAEWIFSEHFEQKFINIFVSMVKAKFTFFQMKVKSVLGQTPKTNKSCFGKSPEALDAVNV